MIRAPDGLRAQAWLLDFALGGVEPLDCQAYDAWGAFLGFRFHADKPSLRGNDCLARKPFLNSQLRLPSCSRPINRGGNQPAQGRQSAGIFPHPRCRNYLLPCAHSIGAVDAHFWILESASQRSLAETSTAILSLSPAFYVCTPR